MDQIDVVDQEFEKLSMRAGFKFRTVGNKKMRTFTKCVANDSRLESKSIATYANFYKSNKYGEKQQEYTNMNVYKNDIMIHDLLKIQ